MENKWGMHMKTSISEKIAYGMGDVACNVVYAREYETFSVK